MLIVVLLAFPIHAQTIRVAIDATDAPGKIFHAHPTIPTAAKADGLAAAIASGVR